MFAVLLFAVMMSGVLLSASFPPLDLSYLVWIGLVPLLIAVQYVVYWQTALLGFVLGIVFAGLYMQWVTVIPGFPMAAFPFLLMYIALYYALFAFLLRFFSKKTKLSLVVAAPVIWVSLEYARCNMGFLAIPGGNLGHTQYQNIPLIQIASITSSYGISFLIVLVNAAIAHALIFFWQASRQALNRRKLKRTIISNVLIGSSIVLVMAWGRTQLSNYDAEKKDIIKIAVVQGNISQEQIKSLKYRREIYQRYKELSSRAAVFKPELIIWPETSIPGYIKTNIRVANKIFDVTEQLGIPLVLGSSSSNKISKEKKLHKQMRNSAFLVNQEGQIVSEYHKIRLVPFAEYVPLDNWISWPKGWSTIKKPYEPGTDLSLFYVEGIPFGITICWENLFSSPFQEFVKQGAAFMVNLTNENWFDHSEAGRQFLAISVFRAVENRVALVRAANTGISALIDPVGNIQNRVKDSEGQDLRVEGTLNINVPSAGGTTFFTRYGNIFAIVCIACTIGFFVLTIMGGKSISK